MRLQHPGTLRPVPPPATAGGVPSWQSPRAETSSATPGQRTRNYALPAALRPTLSALAAYALFAALALVYAAPEWRWGRVAFEDDTRLFYYPVLAAVGEALRHGSLSLWTPGMFGGYPLLADGGIGPLYPPHFVLLQMLAADQALVWLRVLHLFLASVFAFHYLRVLGVGTLGGLVGGVTFAYGGYFAAQTVHTNLREASVWLPAALYCVERARRGRWLPWAALGGVALGIQGLAVHVNITLMSGLFVALYTPLVCLAAPGGSRPPHWWGWPLARAGRLVRGGLVLAVVGGVAVGLAAVQLLPIYELGTESFRGRGLSSGFAAVNSIAPLSLITLLLPRFFDDPTLTPTGWGIWVAWETEIYLGLVPLLLALVALLVRPSFYVLLYALVAVVAMLVGFGTLGPWPLWERLREVPFFNTLQSPGRFSLFSTLACAVLAGYGTAWLTTRAGRLRDRWTGVGLLVVGGIAVAGLVALYQARSWIEAHREWALGLLATHLATPGAPTQGGAPYPADWAYPRLLAALDVASPPVEQQVRLLVAGLAALAAVYAAARLGGRSGRAAVLAGAVRGVAAALVIGAVAVDLLGFGQDYHPRTALADLHVQLPPPLAQAPPLGEARIFTRPDPTRKFVDAPNVLLPTGWEEATGFSSLESDRHARYVAQVEQTDNHLLDLLNARYVLDRGKAPDLPVFRGVPYHPGRPLLNGTAANPGARAAFTVAKVDSHEIGLISWLRGAGDVPQGAEIGKVTVSDASGATYTLPLQAGVHTADADLDGAPPDRPSGHQPATVAEAHPAALDDGRTYEQRRYYGVVRLPKTVPIARLEVQYTWPTGELELFGLSPLRPDGQVEPIPPKEKYRWLHGDQQWLVAENTAALPRAFLVSSAQMARQDQDVLAWMSEGAFDPRKLAILEREGRAAQSPWPGWRLEQDVPPGQARVERYRPEEIVIRTSSAHDGFLVLLDSYYPGWVASVDGQSAEVLRADYLFRGVFVPAGERMVRFSYQPVPFRVGAAVSLLTLAVVALLFYGLLARGLVRWALRWGRAWRPLSRSPRLPPWVRRQPAPGHPRGRLRPVPSGEQGAPG